MYKEYESCTLCPRQCGVNRVNNKTGYCRVTADLIVSRAALHMWEEPCISGTNGSGTVFFSGCSMQCVYCQNQVIANANAGVAISIQRLSEIFIELQDKGAHNINLVTPSHYVPHLVEAIPMARKKGLIIPIVYNCCSYEKVETLRKLEGFIDIYLPDLKYYSGEISIRYSNCSDYFNISIKAIEEMVRQVGEPVFDKDDIMKNGVIIRHLALPGYIKDSKEIIKYIYETYHDNVYISIMNQFTPMDNLIHYPEINKTLDEKQYDELVDYAINLGVENGFIQEGETAKESFIPDFNNFGVLCLE
jgi:putative pyruvate formate lyase activating enzyme